MKAKSIKLEYTINTGNYQNTKIGVEYELEESDNGMDLSIFFLAARNELRKAYKEMTKE